MLIVLSGLPGVGKSTIAQRLARKLHATYLRIDTIERALAAQPGAVADVGASGYLVAYQLASSNLCLGGTVIADAVNPLEITRRAWQEVAQRADSAIVEVEVVCSNVREHQRRVEQRISDISQHVLPTWNEVQCLVYEPWTGHRLVIDSATLSAEEGAAHIFQTVGGLR